jgi:hypothetical protein
MPSAMDDLIVEMPEDLEDDSLRDKLQQLFDYAAPRCSESDRMAIQKLLSQYSSPSDHFAELAAKFDEAENVLRPNPQTLPEVVAKLYKEGLDERSLPLQGFSSAIAFLQLQAILGIWRDPAGSGTSPSPYQDPTSAFYGYVEAVAALPDTAELTATLAEIGNGNYRWAVASIKRGINGNSLRNLINELVLGFHQYSIAFMVAQSARLTGLECGFCYTLTQAEEGFVCTQSGLLYPTDFLFDEIDALPLYFLERLSAGKSDSEIVTAYSSPQFPLFTKKFLRVLLACARAYSTGETFERGFRDLKSLESEFNEVSVSMETPFERGWINRALLKAYKKKGDEAQAMIYANKIAFTLVMERAFHSPGQARPTMPPAD